MALFGKKPSAVATAHIQFSSGPDCGAVKWTFRGGVDRDYAITFTTIAFIAKMDWNLRKSGEIAPLLQWYSAAFKDTSRLTFPESRNIELVASVADPAWTCDAAVYEKTNWYIQTPYRPRGNEPFWWTLSVAMLVRSSAHELGPQEPLLAEALGRMAGGRLQGYYDYTKVRDMGTVPYAVLEDWPYRDDQSV